MVAEMAGSAGEGESESERGSARAGGDVDGPARTRMGAPGGVGGAG